MRGPTDSGPSHCRECFSRRPAALLEPHPVCADAEVFAPSGQGLRHPEESSSRSLPCAMPHRPGCCLESATGYRFSEQKYRRGTLRRERRIQRLLYQVDRGKGKNLRASGKRRDWNSTVPWHRRRPFPPAPFVPRSSKVRRERGVEKVPGEPQRLPLETVFPHLNPVSSGGSNRPASSNGRRLADP